MRLMHLVLLPFIAVLTLSKPAESAGFGEPDGPTVLCVAALESISRQPDFASDLSDDSIAALQRILRHGGRRFGVDKGRSLGLINAAYITALARNPDAPNVPTALATLRDVCEQAVITGRVDPF